MCNKIWADLPIAPPSKNKQHKSKLLTKKLDDTKKTLKTNNSMTAKITEKSNEHKTKLRKNKAKRNRKSLMRFTIKAFNPLETASTRVYQKLINK